MKTLTTILFIAILTFTCNAQITAVVTFEGDTAAVAYHIFVWEGDAIAGNPFIEDSSFIYIQSVADTHFVVTATQLEFDTEANGNHIQLAGFNENEFGVMAGATLSNIEQKPFADGTKMIMLSLILQQINPPVNPMVSNIDSIACASVSDFPDSMIVGYDDSTHSYINTGGDAIILSTLWLIKRGDDYIHKRNNLVNTFITVTPSIYIPNEIQVDSIYIEYQDSILYVTWEIPDTQSVDWFHIFYAEEQTGSSNPLDSSLSWGMNYIDCKELEIGTNKYEYYYCIPKGTYPPFTSMIRIGIIAEVSYPEPNLDIKTYSKLFLAPDITNQ